MSSSTKFSLFSKRSVISITIVLLLIASFVAVKYYSEYQKYWQLGNALAFIKVPLWTAMSEFHSDVNLDENADGVGEYPFPGVYGDYKGLILPDTVMNKHQAKLSPEGTYQLPGYIVSVYLPAGYGKMYNMQSFFNDAERNSKANLRQKIFLVVVHPADEDAIQSVYVIGVDGQIMSPASIYREVLHDPKPRTIYQALREGKKEFTKDEIPHLNGDEWPLLWSRDSGLTRFRQESLFYRNQK